MTARQHRIFHKLSVTAHQLQKLADQKISATSPITTAQAAVLSALKNKEAKTQSEIALLLGLNESAITAMMERLRRAGFTDRTRSKSDGRVWELHLTAAGAQALDQTVAPFSEINRILDRALSSEELTSMANGLSRIQELLAEANSDRQDQD